MKCNREILRAVPILLLLAAATFGRTQDAAAVFAKAKGAVVTVSTPSRKGTGFIIGDGTVLVTCYHVVDGDPISRIEIGLGTVRIAHLIASERDADVAVFRLSGAWPESLTLNSGALPATGSRVFVIGTPLGFLRHTISEGIVSGVRQTSKAQLLQISAPISPGSSGSPVLDSSSRVVGMVRSTIEEGQALNFAISASDILLVERLSRPAPLAGPAPPISERRPTQPAPWPAGDPRLADLASKLASDQWGDEAARKLAEEGPGAVPFLIAAINVFSGNDTAFARAYKALAQIGAPAVEPLIRALSNSESQVRDQAAFTLAELGLPAVEPLIRAIATGGEWVRERGTFALGGIKDPRAVGQLIRALSSGNESVRTHAAIALGRIGEPAVDPLIGTLSTGDQWPERMAAAFALGNIKDLRAVGPLIRALSDSDKWVRDSATTAIWRIGKPAVEPLIRALSNCNSYVRESAAYALGNIKDLRAVEPLKRLSSDPNPEVREAVRVALRMIGG